MILGLEHVTIMVMKHVRLHEAEDLPCGTFQGKNGQNQLAKKWKLVTIVNKLVYNLFRGRIQPAYIGVKYSIYYVPAGHPSYLP